MKLITKLLPITAMGCMASIITPLTASCSCSDKNNILAEATIKDLIDQTYTRSTELKEQQSIAEDQMLDTYFDDIASNKTIFCEDIMEIIQWAILHPFSIPRYHNFIINGTGKIGIGLSNVNKQDHKLSANAETDFRIEIQQEDNPSEVFVLGISGSISVSNVAVATQYDEVEDKYGDISKWYIRLNYANEDEVINGGWTAKVNCIATFKQDGEEHQVSYKGDIDPKSPDELSQFALWFVLRSIGDEGDKIPLHYLHYITKGN